MLNTATRSPAKQEPCDENPNKDLHTRRMHHVWCDQSPARTAARLGSQDWVADPCACINNCLAAAVRSKPKDRSPPAKTCRPYASNDFFSGSFGPNPTFTKASNTHQSTAEQSPSTEKSDQSAIRIGSLPSLRQQPESNFEYVGSLACLLKWFAASLEFQGVGIGFERLQVLHVPCLVGNVIHKHTAQQASRWQQEGRTKHKCFRDDLDERGMLDDVWKQHPQTHAGNAWEQDEGIHPPILLAGRLMS